MVATAEIVFLIVCAVLGIWWFRGTKLYRARNGRNSDPNSGPGSGSTSLPHPGGTGNGGGGG
jgi:hypothetical protein